MKISHSKLFYYFFREQEPNKKVETLEDRGIMGQIKVGDDVYWWFTSEEGGVYGKVGGSIPYMVAGR